MKVIEAIASIRAAIDVSAEAKNNHAWRSAVTTAGLKSQGDTGTMGIDEDYVENFGPLEVRVKHTMRDTSKPFSIGPDRTRITLSVSLNGAKLDSYTNGYED